MGADPATLSLILGMLGSSAIGGLTAPQGQQLKSFEGIDGIDPRTMLGESKGVLDDLLGSLIESANAPITMRTTVNPTPSFVGGGLPMAISSPGQDANRMNPALRTSEAPSIIPRRRLSTGGTDFSSQKPGAITVPGGPNGSDFSLDNGANFRGGYQIVPPTSHPANQGVPRSTTDPVDSAHAAIELLLRQAGGSGSRTVS